jgi:C4-dicarboxylate-specific signal transduction histidine kinase
MSAHRPDARLDEILDVLLAFARHDFTRRAPVHGSDTIDAISTGLNMLAEELHQNVASRRELVAAYDELRRAEAKLVQAGKMAAIGLLASGVAHEVNNPAAWVSLALSMMKRNVAKTHRLLDEGASADAIREELLAIDSLLVDCVEGMKRVNAVVGDLLVFSRADDASFEPIAFDEVISSSWRLASTALGDVALEVDLANAPTLVANRGRIAQVVMNLLLNAAHAVSISPPEPRRRIIVSTRAQDGGVLLAVEDSGQGIPEEIRARVFDPFFTTKPPREGTGLGLTIVAQIAASYGGWARVASPQNGGGARIEVWFPCEARPETETLPGERRR